MHAELYKVPQYRLRAWRVRKRHKTSIDGSKIPASFVGLQYIHNNILTNCVKKNWGKVGYKSLHVTDFRSYINL